MTPRACYRARLALLRRLCGWLGHNPSWVAAIAAGYTDRPVCADCGAVLDRDPTNAPRLGNG
jgi:hypothetical protein